MGFVQIVIDAKFFIKYTRYNADRSIIYQKNLNTTLDQAEDEIKKLQQNLISTEELQRIKAQVLASDIYQKDSNFYQAMEIGTLETVGLGWQKADEYVPKINQVTAEQVRDVARKYLIDDHLSIAYLEPQTINSTTEKKGVK